MQNPDEPRKITRANGGNRQGPPWKNGARVGARVAGLQEKFETLLGRNVLWSVVAIVVLTPLLSQQQCGLPMSVLATGEVARATVRATSDIELADEASTRARRAAEGTRIPPVYDHLVGLPQVQAARLSDLFASGRALLDGGKKSGAPGAGLERLGEALPYPLPRDAVAHLAARRFSPQLEAQAAAILTETMRRPIVSRRDALPAAGPIAVREIGGADSSAARVVADLVGISDLEQARRGARERIETRAADRPRQERRTLLALVEALMIPTLSYNAQETQTRRETAMASVPEIVTRIPRGRVIVREGEIVSADVAELLQRIQEGRNGLVNWKGLAGGVILVSLMLLFLYRYVIAHQRLFRRVKNLYTMVVLVACMTVIGTWVGAFIAEAVSERFLMAPFDDPSTYDLVLPVAAGGMLVTLLANARVAMVSSSVNALLFGVLLGWDARAMVFALLSSFAGIYGISRYEKRTAILKASAWVATVNAGLALAIGWLERGMDANATVVFEMAAAAVGGMLIAPVVSFGLPILEWLFNVLTEIRLLELSSLDNPLLRQLSLQAPGTYNHSIIVGTLAEQAADEIGAHALLCRVAANYHDIGKMTKPDYFVENMRGEENRHDKLSPRMSSLIIASHVKEGLRLADEHSLPRQIRDIIPQHHGTRLITFFYRKAKRREDPDVPEIHESDYRYPGPRPQTREAAIVMMADSIEAAARTVEEPTPAKFEEVINRMSNAIILDHQLDECDLTFSDLGKMRAAFLKTLTAVHHHRISYPGFDFDRTGPRAVEAE